MNFHHRPRAVRNGLRICLVIGAAVTAGVLVRPIPTHLPAADAHLSYSAAAMNGPCYPTPASADPADARSAANAVGYTNATVALQACGMRVWAMVTSPGAGAGELLTLSESGWQSVGVTGSTACALLPPGLAANWQLTCA